MNQNSLLENCREYYEEKYPAIMHVSNIGIVQKGFVVGEFFNKYLFSSLNEDHEVIVDSRHLKILVKG